MLISHVISLLVIIFYSSMFEMNRSTVRDHDADYSCRMASFSILVCLKWMDQLFLTYSHHDKHTITLLVSGL